MRHSTRGRDVFVRGAVALVILLAGAGGVRAQCPEGTFVIDLEKGQTMPATPPGSMALLSLAPSQNPSCPGWYAAVVRLDLRGCHEALVVVEWDKPIAWTVHIADSPTSDGYGGDAGTTLNNAELWINQQLLWVATNRTNGVNDNELVQENLDLNDGAMKFEVSNQRIAWGRPYHALETPNLKKLFALPDTVNPAEGYYVYLGLNRVVADFPTRQGCGAQRAMITIE